MEIKKVISDKKEFLELLLLADEQESMIDRYLERGDMFVLYDDGLKACCVVTCEGERIYEIKNIATISFFQRQGYGKRLIQFLFEHYQGRCSEMLVGTGDVPSTRSFYEHCGFTISHRVENFFTDNYDHPMYEDGEQLVGGYDIFEENILVCNDGNRYQLFGERIWKYDFHDCSPDDSE